MNATQTLVFDGETQAQKAERKRVNLNRFCLFLPPVLYFALSLPPIQNVSGFPLGLASLALLLTIAPALCGAVSASTPRRLKEPAISFIAGWILMMAVTVLTAVFNI